MKFTRRRSDRPESARNRQGLTLEALERRELLSRDTYAIFSAYAPSDLPIKNIQSGRPIAYSAQNALLRNPTVTNPLLNNEGKVVSGQDRQGNEWTITVHGPGNVIVTDTTPNDGVLDDSIDTIQLIGTSINSTFVTGTVLGSNQVATDSSVAFNRLIATSGVNSIQLNGFNLAETVAPATGQPNNQNTGIYLSGGVRTLSFANIDAPIDQATADYPINIVIGNPASPLHVQPSIHINSIFNTVFNSTATTIPTAPQTNPTVSIVVNGQIKSLDFISTGQGDVPAALTYTYPTVGTTGRTSVQATGIGRISVNGSATNFTASRTPQPFQNGFSGLSHLDSASFKGKTDAVGLDVNGPIRSLTYRRGIGNPSGTFVATNAAGQALPATQYGQTTVNAGYPASGLLGGQVTATSIGKLVVGPANYTNLTPTNPAFQQIHGVGTQTYITHPGNAITSSAIVTSGNIGKTRIVGDVVNSEIKSGFHYPSYAAGLEGTRAASKIGRIDVRGSLVNGVVSSSYRPGVKFQYGSTTDKAGNGSINGNLTGTTYFTGGVTPLRNTGTGFFARNKRGGYLPPPAKPATVNGIPVSRV